MANKKVLELNCLGDICPVPLIRLQEAIKSMENGQSIRLITDHSCTQRSVYEYCLKADLDMYIDEVISGVWEITITKL